jgi:hypothetical protein
MPGFDYFCSANVLVYIGDRPLLEAAGLSYDVQESKRPIYGYSSRMFDAVARGNVLVSGEILINYVHQDYLYDEINAALGVSTAAQQPNFRPEVSTELTSGADLLDQAMQNNSSSLATKQALASRYWNVGQDETLAENTPQTFANTYNPIDSVGGVNIKVAFGEQNSSMPNGRSAYLLENVHFTGRGQRIFVDHESIVESYTFFARNVRTLNVPIYKSVDVVTNSPNSLSASNSVTSPEGTLSTGFDPS